MAYGDRQNKDIKAAQQIGGGFITNTQTKGRKRRKIEVHQPTASQLTRPPEDPQPVGMVNKDGVVMPFRYGLKMGLYGMDPTIIGEGDRRYKAALLSANRYRRARQKELFRLHGHVSVGAAGMLAAASMAMAASRFMYERFALPEELGGGDIDLLKKAAQMADSARCNELAAWELAAREGQLRRHQEASHAVAPWLHRTSDPSMKKRGRPTKAMVLARQQDTAAPATEENPKEVWESDDLTLTVEPEQSP